MVLPFTENNNPTPYPQVNAILHELLHEVQQILGKHLLGMYLEGSLSRLRLVRTSNCHL